MSNRQHTTTTIAPLSLHNMEIKANIQINKTFIIDERFLRGVYIINDSCFNKTSKNN